MAHDSTALSDQTTIPDRNDWIGDALLSWKHPCAQGDTGADHCLRTNVDVMLVINRVGWETDNAVTPKTPKLPTPSGIWAYGAMKLNTGPNPVDQTMHRRHATLRV